jgi:hypothetical protein
MMLVPFRSLAATACCALLAASAGASTAGEVRTRDQLILHSGPSPRFVVLGVLSTGTNVRVLWCNASAEWCKVDASGLQGWTPFAELKLGSNDKGPAAHPQAEVDTGADSGTKAGVPQSLTSATGAGVGAAVSPGSSGAGASLKATLP